jgi:micrococcal nuclease
MFEYKAIVTSVYDADTITVDIDLGFHIWARNEKIRLLAIDAPEVRGVERPEGLKSRNWLREKILGSEIVLITQKDGSGKGKYGRWLGDIYLPGETVSLNQQMVDLGLAEPASY